jgi:hypothetical protein
LGGGKGEDYEWSSLYKWWSNYQPFEDEMTLPARKIFDVVNEVHRGDKEWVKGSAHHRRLTKFVSGCALFYSFRCFLSHPEKSPRKMSYVEEYGFLLRCEANVKRGTYAFASAIMRDALVRCINDRLKKFSVEKDGRIRHRATNTVFGVES